MWQELLVALLVGASGLYMGRRIYKAFRADPAGESPCGCDCSCEGCGQTPGDCAERSDKIPGNAT